MIPHRTARRIPPCYRAMVPGPVASHGFDPGRSFGTTVSSIASAARRFSFAFSS